MTILGFLIFGGCVRFGTLYSLVYMGASFYLNLTSFLIMWLSVSFSMLFILNSLTLFSSPKHRGCRWAVIVTGWCPATIFIIKQVLLKLSGFKHNIKEWPLVNPFQTCLKVLKRVMKKVSKMDFSNLLVKKHNAHIFYIRHITYLQVIHKTSYATVTKMDMFTISQNVLLNIFKRLFVRAWFAKYIESSHELFLVTLFLKSRLDK